MKYCIGCTHLYFDSGSPDDCMGSTMTGAYGGHSASMACQKGHWDLYLNLGANVDAFDIEQAMRHADKCPDYEERTTESETEVQK